MYTPRFNAMSDEAQMRGLVAQVGSAQLVTVDVDGFPLATLLPVMWSGNTVLAHFARANSHWKQIEPGAPALVIVQGPQSYISPSWYAAKAEHGRVVPTWNYSAVQLRGRASVFHDHERLRDVVTRLTDLHETGREHPWAVTDAPEKFVDGQLHGIVGVEVSVESVSGKAKLSQNRSDADRDGVIAGLDAESDEGARAVAKSMRGLSAD